MNKNTKMLLGVSIIGVGGYLIWKSLKPSKTTSFTGNLNPGPLFSKKQNMSGKKKKNLTDIKTDVSRDSGWLRGDGTTMKGGDFFNVENSGWMR